MVYWNVLALWEIEVSKVAAWYPKENQLERMNLYNHHNSVSFKSHSISVTFKFCAVLVALRALEPRSTDSLGTQHCANFESHSNRVTFETNAIMVIVKVHPQYGVEKICN